MATLSSVKEDKLFPLQSSSCALYIQVAETSYHCFKVHLNSKSLDCCGSDIMSRNKSKSLDLLMLKRFLFFIFGNNK
ncbi:hypothetical protein A2U01_0051422, partial [Trifolium medium]|nr:hypothetical protein [Trifolium medium]